MSNTSPRRCLFALLWVAQFTVALAAAGGQAPPPPPPPKSGLTIPKADAPIVVDGILEEPIWQRALRVDLPYEVNPGENVPAKVSTEALLTYDESRLYVAFRAADPDPNEIRARLTDRDRAFEDDFVGIVVDTFNDQRRAFELFVNPLGVQMDLVVDEMSGHEDETWDAIWDSAGSLDGDGYTVEMAIPYTSLRFQRGEGSQTWGIDVVRAYPRTLRHIFASNARDRNVSCYLCQLAKVSGFAGAEPGKNLEITPTLTAIRTDERGTFPSGRLEDGSPDYDPGVTVKWGVTPNLTATAAVNPDFSQVEADAAQLGVNEQFALYYPEKRPFFLEGADFFLTPLQAVHTRTVADPAWGAKVTGKEGRNVVGAFVTRDDLTNLLMPGSQVSSSATLFSPVTGGVLRYRRDVGKASTIGLLVTDREGDAYFNRVAGADSLLRLTDSDSIRAQALWSQSRYPEDLAVDYGQPGDDFTDRALRLNYHHSTRNWYWEIDYKDLGERFRADLGFMPQVNIRRPAAVLGYTWWAPPDRWYSKIFLGAGGSRTVEQDGNQIERGFSGWTEIYAVGQSRFYVEAGRQRNWFREDGFLQPFIDTCISGRPAGWLYLHTDVNYRKQVDYAYVDPLDAGRAREGYRLRLAPSAEVNLGRRLRVSLSHEMRRLGIDDGYLFRANLSQMNLAFQMNIRTFLRAIVQYSDVTRNLSLYPACSASGRPPNPPAPSCSLSSESRDLFTQLLFSYKVNPQTAIYVGYTDSQVGIEDPDLGLEDASLSRTGRTFFFKIGRAWVM